MECENCWYNEYDSENDEYYCSLELDEDEYARFMYSGGDKCRYFRPYNGEYDIVKSKTNVILQDGLFIKAARLYNFWVYFYA